MFVQWLICIYWDKIDLAVKGSIRIKAFPFKKRPGKKSMDCVLVTDISLTQFLWLFRMSRRPDIHHHRGSRSQRHRPNIVDISKAIVTFF